MTRTSLGDMGTLGTLEVSPNAGDTLVTRCGDTLAEIGKENKKRKVKILKTRETVVPELADSRSVTSVISEISVKTEMLPYIATSTRQHSASVSRDGLGRRCGRKAYQINNL